MSSERDDVAREIAARLRGRGVRLTGAESDEQLMRLLEAVERFEAVVEQRGGDLMIDEPIHGSPPRDPDDRRFVLPERHGNESVDTFLSRIVVATDRAAG